MSRARVLVPLGPGFEELEAIAVIDVLRRAGCHVVTASVGAANPIVGRNRIRVMADLDIEDALVEWGESWDLVVLPGGLGGVAAIEAHEGLSTLLRERLAAGGLTAAICAAPRALKAAGLPRSTALTGHPACRADLEDYDQYRTDAVVVDGHVITSRGPGTALAFGLACVEALCGPGRTAEIQEQIVAR